jgi:hypothetical protein
MILKKTIKHMVESNYANSLKKLDI